MTATSEDPARRAWSGPRCLQAGACGPKPAHSGRRTPVRTRRACACRPHGSACGGWKHRTRGSTAAGPPVRPASAGLLRCTPRVDVPARRAVGCETADGPRSGSADRLRCPCLPPFIASSAPCLFGCLRLQSPLAAPPRRRHSVTGSSRTCRKDVGGGGAERCVRPRY